MGEQTSLYERDFVAWTEDQAARIRAAGAAGLNLPIDWEAVATEIEDLGKSDAREVQSRLTTIVEHLLKLRFSTARAPRAGWIETVLRERGEIETLLEQSPSLRTRVGGMLERANRNARKTVEATLTARRESDVSVAQALRDQEFSEDQVLGGWLP